LIHQIYNLDRIIICLVSSDPSFSEEIIFYKLNYLKIAKSPGHDNIHPRILYQLRYRLTLPLKIMIDTSYKLNKLPSDWKTGHITAIFDKGNKCDPSNYKPISKNQYGFIKGRSTVLQLLSIMDDWTTKLDSGSQIDTIDTDFAKAFDTVPHRRLLYKYNHIILTIS